MTWATIRCRRPRPGLPPGTPARRSSRLLVQDRRKATLKMWRQGRACEQIGEQFGVATQTVAADLRRRFLDRAVRVAAHGSSRRTGATRPVRPLGQSGRTGSELSAPRPSLDLDRTPCGLVPDTKPDVKND